MGIRMHMLESAVSKGRKELCLHVLESTVSKGTGRKELSASVRVHSEQG